MAGPDTKSGKVNPGTTESSSAGASGATSYVGTPAVGTSKAVAAAGLASVGPAASETNERRRRLVWCAVTAFLGAWFIAFLRFFLPQCPCRWHTSPEGRKRSNANPEKYSGTSNSSRKDFQHCPRGQTLPVNWADIDLNKTTRDSRLGAPSTQSLGEPKRCRRVRDCPQESEQPRFSPPKASQKSSGSPTTFARHHELGANGKPCES